MRHSLLTFTPSTILFLTSNAKLRPNISNSLSGPKEGLWINIAKRSNGHPAFGCDRVGKGCKISRHCCWKEDEDHGPLVCKSGRCVPGQ